MTNEPNINHGEVEMPKVSKLPEKKYYLKRLFIAPVVLGLILFVVFLIVDIASIVANGFSLNTQWNGYIVIPLTIPIIFIVAVVQGALMRAKLPFFIFPWNIQALGKGFLTGITMLVFILISACIFILLFMIYSYIKLFFIA